MATIAYPIDLGAWDVITPEDRLEARKDLGIEIGTFVAVMVAYFYAPRRWVLGGRSVKGHEVALEGWAEFRRRGGEGTLLLVGGGFGETGDAYRRALLDKAGARSDASIRIVETVSNVRPYYAAADVSVAPSRSENLGSAAEASALGVPTIASNVGGLPELVRPGQTGWLVEPEDWRGLAAAFGHCSAMRNEPVMDEMRRATRRAVDDVASASHVLPLWRSAIRGDDDSSHG
jgi:glycosyltransferase involved in cell wall biosynthesis